VSAAEGTLLLVCHPAAAEHGRGTRPRAGVRAGRLDHRKDMCNNDALRQVAITFGCSARRALRRWLP